MVSKCVCGMRAIVQLDHMITVRSDGDRPLTARMRNITLIHTNNLVQNERYSKHSPIASISLENLFSIRPIGVVSKNDIGADSIPFVNLL
jgi:hypothetical protein